MAVNLNSNSFESMLQTWVHSSDVTGNKKEAENRILKAYQEEDSDLDLSQLELTSLPECLGQLKNLTYLNLDINRLSFLPESLGKLKRLAMLVLTYNEQLVDLPESFKGLTSLKAILAGGTSTEFQEKCNQVIKINQSFAVQARSSSLKVENLLFSQRPPEVQAEIDRVFESLKVKSFPNWGHNGNVGSYNLLGIKDVDVIAQRIEKASPHKKELYFIDLGAGNFSWIKEIKSFLSRHFKDDKRHFHVIGTIAEGEETLDDKETVGNITTHRIHGFKLENLLESFQKLDLDIVDSAEFIVCSWTLQHLVDPLGTLEQAYQLLTKGNGMLFGTGFLEVPCNDKNSFSTTLKETFGMNNYITRRSDFGPETFGLYRDDEYNFSNAKRKFSYNNFKPLKQRIERQDSYAQFYANIRANELFSNFDIEVGAFHGSSLWVLQILFGKNEKEVPYYIKGERRIVVTPLFGTGDTHFLKLYLENSTNFQIDLQKIRL